MFPAPRFLKGTLQSGTYIAPDRRFTVAVPFKAGTEEYMHMPVKEQLKGEDVYVSFGPAAIAFQIYRVEVVRKSIGIEKMPFDEVSEKIVDAYKLELQNGYASEIIELLRSDTKVGEQTAKYWHLTQVVNGSKTIGGEPDSYDHQVYVIEFPTAYALVTVQTQKSSFASGISATKFVSSLVVP